MLSSDQTHLRRYLTTVGVSIAAGTLSLAGLFFKLEQDLLVTDSVLSQLTPTARAALLERQRYLAIGTSILPYFVLVGFLGGLSLAAYGLIGWGHRQRVTDALEDLALQRGQVEFRQMTAQEQAEKLTREAEESVAAAAPPTSSDAMRTDEQAVAEVRQQLVSNSRNRAMILEASLVYKLQKALGSGGFHSNIDLSGPGSRVTVDAIAHIGDRHIVFELKYATDATSARRRMTDALLQGERGVEAVIGSGFHNVYGVVIFVVSDSVDDSAFKGLISYANETGSRFEFIYQVLVWKYSDFLLLSPNDFVRRSLSRSLGRES